jgi:predicted molibdopterin-dependent oxidoreductase YjgC
MTIVEPSVATVELTINGELVEISEGATILDACTAAGLDTPTLCYGDTVTPVNACRVCVVEVEGSGPLVPSCSRPVEPNMVVSTGSERVDRSRRMVLELLASSVKLDRAGDELQGWITRYEADTDRFGINVATVAQPAKVHDDLYVRDYERCILCYKCVEACGEDAQNTFAIAVAGRGFDAEISTEFDINLAESACVYCGNCIEVCPTGALTPLTQYKLAEADNWRPEDQDITRTVCSYCGVGCNLELHVQDDEIVRVTSPHDHSVTHGNLCVKGRFGWQYLGNNIKRKKRRTS